MALTLADLFARGAVFALHCGYWRARERILPTDLGLDDTPDVRRALALGAVKLAPAEALAPVLAVQRRAASEIDANSLNFRMIPGARYVPTERVEGLSLVLSQLRGQFEPEADAFAASYADTVRTQLAMVYSALVEALTRSHKDARQLAERAIDRITRELPDAGEVRRRFYLRWNVYVLDSVDSALADQLAETEGEVASVIEGMVEGLRSDVEATLRNVVDVLTRGGKWTERSVTAAESVFSRAETMNILNDTRLSALISQARGLVRSVNPEGDTEGVVSALSSVADALIEDSAQAVAEAERALTSYSRRKLTRAPNPSGNPSTYAGEG